MSGFGGERSVVTAVLGLQKVLGREVHRAFPWRPGAGSGRMPPWWVTFSSAAEHLTRKE